LKKKSFFFKLSFISVYANPTPPHTFFSSSPLIALIFKEETYKKSHKTGPLTVSRFRPYSQAIRRLWAGFDREKIFWHGFGNFGHPEMLLSL